jgi:transglutaminase-like putative cysteine protease
VNLLAAVRRANRTTRPEESVTLRIAVTASVMVGVLAVAVSGTAPLGDALAALVLLPVGAWVSWRRRGSDNIPVKVALTVGAVLALWRFFGDLRGTVSLDDTRAPLAALFLAVQVLHGFDLPQRRDLGFTLASSLTLVGLAATSTHSGLFGVLLVVYVGLAAVSLVGMQRSGARERADELRERTGARPLAGGDPEAAGASAPSWRSPTVAVTAGALARSGPGLLRAAIPVMLAGTLVFMLLPRSSSQQFGMLPFRGFPGLALPTALVTNPGLDDGGAGGGPGSRPPAFRGGAYVGFSEYVDLRTVGELDPTPVLRVRADRPRLWRGMVFTTYDGVGWVRESEVPPPVYGRPVRLGPDHQRLPDASGPGGTIESLAWEQRSRVVQTYELVSDTPNLLFAAADPELVFVAGGSVNAWADGTLSTTQLQDAGTIYSVVSRVDLTAPAELRGRTGPVPAAVAQRYLQLPETLPDRVVTLAREVTAGAATPYAKAEAIQGWLRDNVEYTLDAPAPPVDGDVVDHFLFTTRQGWCEPIASSMTVMLRAVGVPARFATGFQPGDRNPISGVWDVRLSDAHAWVEAWVPGAGWVTFDPTGAVPLAVSNEPSSSIPLVQLARWAGAAVAGLVPDGLSTSIREAPAAAGALLAGLLALVGLGVGLTGRRRRRADTPDHPFGRLTALLTTEGVPREPWQTPREYTARVRLRRPELADDDLDTVLADEERRRYAAEAPAPPSPAAEAAVARLAQRLADAARDGRQRER